MTILCWNVRGLGNPRTFRALRYLLRDKNPDVIFLSETKKTIQQMAGVSAQLGAIGQFSVSRNGRAGGLALLWRHGVKVSIRSFSSGHIDAMIEGVTQNCFRFTGFYGNPDLASRKHSWELLHRLADGYSGPWVVGGDFNEVLELNEYLGRRYRPASQMRDFGMALEDCGLTSMKYKGYKYTWTNNRSGDDRVQLRLDRGVANTAFFLAFPGAIIHHVNSLVSNHLPVFIHFGGSESVRWA
ncbi:hypothetical protein CerSpe_171670 [Prunus speciosa]